MLAVKTTRMRHHEDWADVTINLECEPIKPGSRQVDARLLGKLSAHLDAQARSWLESEYRRAMQP